MCSGLSVLVYIPGRCRTGSRPLRTRIDASTYSAAARVLRVRGVVAIECERVVHCRGRRFSTDLVEKTAPIIEKARRGKAFTGLLNPLAAGPPIGSAKAAHLRQRRPVQSHVRVHVGVESYRQHGRDRCAQDDPPQAERSPATCHWFYGPTAPAARCA